MAIEQKNFRYFQYVDDNGAEWSVRGEDGGAGAAVDGHATFDPANPVFGTQTRRRHTRYVIYQDPTTFRIVKFIVYTAAAYALISPGDTVSVAVPGSATEVTYTLKAKIGEKIPLAGAARQLADHA